LVIFALIFDVFTPEGSATERVKEP
jgi:hypothetical protein